MADTPDVVRLSTRQEAFCKYLLEGLPQVEAYRRAYDRPGDNSIAIYSEASELAHSPKVVRRLAEMKAAADASDPTILSVAERRRILSELAKREDVRPRDRIAAVDVHNKMDRLYSEVERGSGVQVINVVVRDQQTKQLTDWLTQGGPALPAGETPVDGEVK